jgi:hypothetical protein
VTPPTVAPQEEDVLAIVAEVMARQGRVHRAESTLRQARRRLGESIERLRRAERRGAAVPPTAAALLQVHGDAAPAVPPTSRETPPGTLRDRIVATLDAAPGETFTVARVALALDHDNRDSIRNTLLVLAAAGRVEKLGAGQYRTKTGGAP